MERAVATIVEFKAEESLSTNERIAVNIDLVTSIRDTGMGITKIYFQGDTAGLPFLPVREEYEEVMRKIAQAGAYASSPQLLKTAR
jgi:hypothetical protein